MTVATKKKLRERASYDPAPLLAVAERLAIAQYTTPAELLGVSERTIHRWKTGGHAVGKETADRLAIRLELHPALLWPEWWDVETD